MIGQLNLALWAVIESFRGPRRGALWPPFLLLFAVNGLCLLLLTQFHRPLLAWFLVPALRGLAGPGAMHYPDFFLGLPGLFSWFNVFLDVVLGAWVFGTAWLIAWKLATGGDPQGSRGEAGRAFGKLLVLRLPVSVLPLLVAVLLPRLFPLREDGSLGPLAQRSLRGGVFLAGILIESAFLFGPAALLLGKRSVMGAFADTFRMLGRAPLAVFLVVLVPNCLNLIVDYAVRHREAIVLQMAPEIVGLVVLAAIAAYTFAAFFVITAGVRIWGARGVGQEGGRG
jgi:uncharacterized membrane protein